MRKLVSLLFLLLLSTSLLAQDRGRDDGWRDRRDYRDAPRDSAFELTPFVGYRWGGTIFESETFLFNRDVDVASSANLGISLGIPLGDTGMKLELLADHQSSQLETEGGLFEPNNQVADIDITYLHAGLQFPFARSRNATPYAIVSAGLANVDPQITGVSAENRFSASAGIGVKVPMSRALSLKVEGRGFFTALENNNNDNCSFCDNFNDKNFYQGEVNLGLTFSF
jgi:hypothetical protein